MDRNWQEEASRLGSVLKTLVLWVLVSLVAANGNSWAQTKLSVQGAGTLYPIGVPQLCVRTTDKSGAAKIIPEVIARDLDLSGYFSVVNPGVYVEEPGCKEPDQFAYADWSIIGVDGLVRGVVEEENGQIRVQLYLHDVQVRKVVLGKEYTGDASQLRRIAHRFANEIMRFFTGEPGIFGSQIAFSSKMGRFKELFVMDMDGHNLRQLTNDRGLALAASWDPAGARIVYTTYRKRMPDIFLIDVNSRKVNQVTHESALELGGKFSRDGQSILMSKTFGRDASIVLYRTNGQLLRRLTNQGGVIDVSPDWSPDNQKIVFCSNRGGGPQIYVMQSDGSNVRRVSFVGSNYCTSPVWSPRGDKIAFVCRSNLGYQVFVSTPEGSQPLQLTSSGRNEDPAWSPDGRYLIYATTAFGNGHVFNLALMRADGYGMKQLTFGRSGDTAPAWSAVVP